MPSYNRLTGENRIELYALKKAGLTQEAIATQLNVHPSTISVNAEVKIPRSAEVIFPTFGIW